MSSDQPKKVLIGGREYFLIGFFQPLPVNGIDCPRMLVIQEMAGLPVCHVDEKDARIVKRLTLKVSKY